MRTLIKAAAERLLLRAGPATLSRSLHRGRGLVLAYHNIIPDGEIVRGDKSLHLPRRSFAEQLDMLGEHGVEVVPLGELLQPDGAESKPSGPARRIAITFDDAYLGAVTAGVEELVRRGLPATIFVVPGLLGGQTFWWDALAATEEGLSPSSREWALREAAGRNAEILAWARRHGHRVAVVPEHARSAGEDAIRRAADREGIELASHTWSHANLARLDEEACLRELTQAAEWLRERHGVQSRWLSYPYGRYGATAKRAAAAVGYDAAFRIEGGWLPKPHLASGQYELPRLNIPAGLSRKGFALRLVGLLCN